MGESAGYGSIAEGKVANFFITSRLPSIDYIPYAYTTPVVKTVVLGGKVQWVRVGRKPILPIFRNDLKYTSKRCVAFRILFVFLSQMFS